MRSSRSRGSSLGLVSFFLVLLALAILGGASSGNRGGEDDFIESIKSSDRPSSRQDAAQRASFIFVGKVEGRYTEYQQTSAPDLPLELVFYSVEVSHTLKGDDGLKVVTLGVNGGGAESLDGESPLEAGSTYLFAVSPTPDYYAQFGSVSSEFGVISIESEAEQEALIAEFLGYIGMTPSSTPSPVPTVTVIATPTVLTTVEVEPTEESTAEVSRTPIASPVADPADNYLEDEYGEF